jgi:hypothetical protein
MFPKLNLPFENSAVWTRFHLKLRHRKKVNKMILQKEIEKEKNIEKSPSPWNRMINYSDQPPMTVATMLKVAANKVLFLRLDSCGGRSNSNEGMLLKAKKLSSTSSSVPVLLKDDPDNFSGSWTAKGTEFVIGLYLERP